MGREILFSERERQVIECLIRSQSNKQIALALGVSVRTVEFHLSNIYAKLGVTSRTEAALKLTEGNLRGSAGADLRESTVAEMDKSADNGEIISPRRLSMKNFAYILGGLLVTTLVIWLVVMDTSGRAAEVLPATSTFTPASVPTAASTATPAAPTATPTPPVSSREHILEQIRQLAAEYERVVQAEKQNGTVELSRDPQTGADIFLFKGDSFSKIYALWLPLNDQIQQLSKLYIQVYRDETRPTPFPTLAAADDPKKIYADYLSTPSEFCPENYDNIPATIRIYDPEDGKYYPMYINDVMARCETETQMFDEWRMAPMLAKVNQAADMALIRQVLGKPDLKLTFETIRDLDNAPWQNAAQYVDETGVRYSVDIESARLAGIQPGVSTDPDISAAETRSMAELRGAARQFALTNSLRLAGLEKALVYSEACKIKICFFRWDYRKDWSGTDWAMMAPFLQVGVRSDGQILTYINTLDLFK
jgi:DNA-binding CsgD family transcriptional regulator